MKKEVKPIAMKCTQEQFESIKPKLEKAGYIISSITSFKECEYLANDFNYKKEISNIDRNTSKKVKKHYKWHHQWNEKVFLESCGEETVPTLEEVKDYFKDAKTAQDWSGTTNEVTFKDLEINDEGDVIQDAFGENWLVLFYAKKGYAKIITYKNTEPKFEITKEDDELWLPVHNYYGFYEVSNMGNVRSLSRKVKHSKNPEFTRDVFGRVLSKSINPQGYNKVQLSMFGINKTHLVYHLVSEVFLGHIDRSDFVCVDHIDEDKTNDKASNLQIITKQQNTKKSFDYKLDRFNKGEYWFHNNGKLVLIDEVTKTHGGTLKCKYIDSDENFAFHGMSVIDRKATTEEATEALKNEAVKRGYKEGVYIKYPWFEKYNLNNETYKPNFEGDTYLEDESFYYKSVRVMRDGIWAEIIPTKTIKEAEELLKELGHEFKIV